MQPVSNLSLTYPQFHSHQGHCPWTHFATHNRINQSIFRMLIEETKTEPTGAMKTKKRAAERMHSLTASFLSFSPDAKHPVGGVPHRQPVGSSAAANSQSHNVPFAKGFLRVAVPHPIRKNTFVLCKNMCAWCSASPGNCMKDTVCCIRKRVQGTALVRKRVQGQCPCWGVGQSPAWFPTLHRETV